MIKQKKTISKITKKNFSKGIIHILWIITNIKTYKIKKISLKT